MRANGVPNLYYFDYLIVRRAYMNHLFYTLVCVKAPNFPNKAFLQLDGSPIHRNSQASSPINEIFSMHGLESMSYTIGPQDTLIWQRMTFHCEAVWRIECIELFNRTWPSRKMDNSSSLKCNSRNAIKCLAKLSNRLNTIIRKNGDYIGQF